MMALPRRRRRATRVCDFCKRRKIKCDRGMPCSLCVKYGKKGCCYSDLFGSSEETEITSAFRIEDGNTINNDKSSTTMSDGPLPPHRSPVTNSNTSVPSVSSSSSSSNASLNSATSISSYGSSYQPTSASNGSKKQPKNFTITTFSTAPKLSDVSPTNSTGPKLLKRNLREDADDDVLRTELESLKSKLRRIESKLHIAPPALPQDASAPSISLNMLASSGTGGDPETPLSSLLDFRNIQRYDSQAFVPPSINASLGMYSPAQIQRQSSVRSLPLPRLQPSSVVGSKTNTSDTSPEVSANSDNQDVDNFFLIVGNNPYESPLDIVDFYSGYATLLRHIPLKFSAGPLSWMGLLGSDKALGAVCQFVQASKAILAEKHNAFYAVQELEKPFAEKAKEEAGLCVDPLFVKDGKETKVVLRKLKPTPLALSSVSKSNINRKAAEMGLTFFEGELDEEMKLVEKIQLVLPRKDVIWRLVTRYFKHLYPYMPFIDEISFREQCERFIGKEDLEDQLEVSNLQVERKSDFSFLGLLLIVLRFSYLTVFTSTSCINPAHLKTDDPSPSTEEKMVLLSNPVNLEVIEVAQLCLNQFNLMRNGSFPVLQLALYTRLYHEFAPEDGDPAQVFTAMLIQMAFGLGLHREPHPSSAKDSAGERYNNLRRKVWHQLLMDDLVDSMNSGTPMSTNPNSFDTQLPSFSPEASNCLDLELEKVTLTGLRHCHETYVPTVELVGLLSNIRGGVSVKALTEKLNYLEREVISKYGRLGGFFEEPLAEELSYSTLKMTIYFTSTIFLVSVFVHIFNFYETKSRADLVFFYSKKIFIIVYQDFLPHFKYFIDNSARIFKDSTDMIVTPGFELAAHKSLMVNYMFLIRICIRRTKILKAIQDGLITSDKHIEKHMDSLLRLMGLLEQSLDILIESLTKISHRYYYAWKISKVQKVLRRLCVNQEFIDRFSEVNKETDALLFSNAQIEELAGIVERALEKISKQKRDKRPPHTRKEGTSRNEEGAMSSEMVPVSSDYPSTHSMGSTDSYSDMNSVQGLSTEQIDLLWYQVLALKNDKEGPSTNYASFTEAYNFGPSNNMGPVQYKGHPFLAMQTIPTDGNSANNSASASGSNGEPKAGFLTLNSFYDLNFDELLDFFDDSVMQTNNPLAEDFPYEPVSN